jgi:hypothetical protein
MNHISDIRTHKKDKLRCSYVTYVVQIKTIARIHFNSLSASLRLMLQRWGDVVERNITLFGKISQLRIVNYELSIKNYGTRNS